jgi:MYXO-CTERM domain-containing protein
MRCVEGLCVDSGLDAGRRDAGELRMDAGPRANPNAGGCGCRAGRSGPGLALGTLLGLLALLARRR